jgi:hypothetical protein
MEHRPCGKVTFATEPWLHCVVIVTFSPEQSIVSVMLVPLRGVSAGGGGGGAPALFTCRIMHITHLRNGAMEMQASGTTNPSQP